MSSLPDKIKKGSAFEFILNYEECLLTVVSSHVLLNGDLLYIYKVNFNPEFTYNTGYTYVIEHLLGGFSRSIKYFRTATEAENTGKS